MQISNFRILRLLWWWLIMVAPCNRENKYEGSTMPTFFFKQSCRFQLWQPPNFSKSITFHQIFRGHCEWQSHTGVQVSFFPFRILEVGENSSISNIPVYSLPGVIVVSNSICLTPIKFFKSICSKFMQYQRWKKIALLPTMPY